MSEPTPTQSIQCSLADLGNLECRVYELLKQYDELLAMKNDIKHEESVELVLSSPGYHLYIGDLLHRSEQTQLFDKLENQLRDELRRRAEILLAQCASITDDIKGIDHER